MIKTWVDLISGVEDEDLVTVEQIDKLISQHKESIETNKAEIAASKERILKLETMKSHIENGTHIVVDTVAEILRLSMDTKQSQLQADKLVRKSIELGIPITKTIELIKSIA